MIPASEIAEVMGGTRVLRRRVRTRKDLSDMIAHGIPKAALDALVTQIVDSSRRRELTYRIVPRATYQRRAVLNPDHSQRAERIARVFAIARAAWKDDEKARRFMVTPHRELDDATPLDAAMTELGARHVEEVIERGLDGLAV